MNEELSSTAPEEQHIREPRPEPFRRWISRPQTIIALSAVVLSVCGLFISIYEASLIRIHHRASVWPHVAVTPSLNPGSVRLFIQNTGVGPARIETAAVTVGEQPKGDWGDLVRSIVKDGRGTNRYQSLIIGRVLAPNSEEKIFELSVDTMDAAGSSAITAMQNKILEGDIDVLVCYCSIYDQCWQSSMQEILSRSKGIDTPRYRRVDSCADMRVSGI